MLAAVAFSFVSVVTAQRALFAPSDPPLPGPVQVNPKHIDFAFEPTLRKVPGIDFLGWGYDATYRDEFFALKPPLFLFSYNNNPKKKERFYQYPVDNEQYAVPDQVYIRTIGRTDSATVIVANHDENRFRLDLKLGLGVSTAQLEGAIKLNLNMIDNKVTNKRICTCYAETELYQLYLGKKYLSEDALYDMKKLSGAPFSKEKPQPYVIFLSTWGTHHVDSVSVGGSVTQQTTYEFNNATDALFIGIAISGKFSAASGAKVALDLSIEIEMANVHVKTQTTASALVVGGDAKFSEFLLHSDNPTAAQVLFESWKSTLMSNPVAVRFRLVETWQLFAVLLNDANMAAQVCEATSFFLMFRKEKADYCAGVPSVLSSSVREGGLARGKATVTMA